MLQINGIPVVELPPHLKSRTYALGEHGEHTCSAEEVLEALAKLSKVEPRHYASAFVEQAFAWAYGRYCRADRRAEVSSRICADVTRFRTDGELPHYVKRVLDGHFSGTLPE